MACGGNTCFAGSRVISGRLESVGVGSGRGLSPGEAGGPGCARELLRVGRAVGKARVQRGFLASRAGLCEEVRGSRAGHVPLRGAPRAASAPEPPGRRRALPPQGRAAALPPRRRRAVDCGLGGCGGLRRGLPRPSRAERVGGERGSQERGRRAEGGVAARRGAAAAPLEAGDVGEAVAAAAEAALRTRGKLPADRTPGRDVREPPRPPLTRERSWAPEGGPVLPGLTGQPTRGGGGKPGSGPAGPRTAAAAEQQSRRDEGWRRRRCARPRSGRLPGTAGRCRPAPLGPALAAPPPRPPSSPSPPPPLRREGPGPHPLRLRPGSQPAG